MAKENNHINVTVQFDASDLAWAVVFSEDADPLELIKEIDQLVGDLGFTKALFEYARSELCNEYSEDEVEHLDCGRGRENGGKEKK